MAWIVLFLSKLYICEGRIPFFFPTGVFLQYLGHCLYTVNTQRIFIKPVNVFAILASLRIKWGEKEGRPTHILSFRLTCVWVWWDAAAWLRHHTQFLLWGITCSFFSLLQLVTPPSSFFHLIIDQCGEYIQQYPPTLLQVADPAFSNCKHPRQINKGPFLCGWEKKKRGAVDLVWGESSCFKG